MSRVADDPVKITDGVTVDLIDQEVKVDGPKGSLSLLILSLIHI